MLKRSQCDQLLISRRDVDKVNVRRFALSRAVTSRSFTIPVLFAWRLLPPKLYQHARCWLEDSYDIRGLHNDLLSRRKDKLQTWLSLALHFKCSLEFTVADLVQTRARYSNTTRTTAGNFLRRYISFSYCVYPSRKFPADTWKVFILFYHAVSV